MGLWQLAGPIPIDADAFSSPSAGRYFQGWFPGVGVTMRVNSADDAVVVLDGIGVNRGSGAYKYNWWPARQAMVTFLSTDPGPSDPVQWQEYLIDPKSWVLQAAEPADPTLIAFFEAIQFQNRPYVRLVDRRVYVEPSVRRVRAYAGGIFSYEGPLIPFFNGWAGPGRTETEIFLANNAGTSNIGNQGIFYDTVTQTFSSALMFTGETDSTGLYYVPEFGVCVSGHGAYGSGAALKVWSLEVRPAFVSVPIRTQGTLKAGQVVTYQTQVTGNQSMACPGELVNWSLTGSGLLLDQQTTTDDNGFATARVQYRVAETGTSTVEASVQC